MRDAQRETWLQTLPEDVVVRFVLRGMGLREAEREMLAAEATKHHDIVRVAASANLSRATGPLNSVSVEDIRP